VGILYLKAFCDRSNGGKNRIKKKGVQGKIEPGITIISVVSLWLT